MEIPANKEDPFYILATDSAADEVTRVLKHGEAFAVFNRHGDIDSTGLGQQGLYCEGTRFLSLLHFKLGNARPFLLDSAIKDDNLLFVVNLTNPDIYQAGRIVLPRGTLQCLPKIKLRKDSRRAFSARSIRLRNGGGNGNAWRAGGFASRGRSAQLFIDFHIVMRHPFD